MRIPAHSRMSSLLLAPLLLATGAPGQEVRHEVVGERDDALGASIAAAGDLDGDGVGDYWAGAPRPMPWGDPTPGYTRLHSGADGRVLRRIRSNDPDELFASALAAGEDLDLDGLPDVVVGAPAGAGHAPGSGVVHAFRGLRHPEVPHVLPVPWSTRLFRVRGDAAGDRLGSALALLDDLDGDGVAEFAIGAPGDDTSGIDAGSVRIVSGASGEAIRVLHGLAGSELGTSLATLWDLDGDGTRELLVGAPHGGVHVPGAGIVFLCSPRTGAVMEHRDGSAAGDLFGWSVALAGDVNADTVPDVLVGAPGGNYARLFSGAGGTELATLSRVLPELITFAPPWWEARFGTTVCGIGDQDGDGHDDVAVACPGNSSVWLFSGASGELLDLVASSQLDIFSHTVSVYFGYALAALDDLDGDGRPELAIGAPGDSPTDQGLADAGTGGVDVLSIAHDPRWERGVARISGIGDVDQDGCDDVVYGRGGLVELRSGCGGALLRTWSGLSAHALAPAGDANGDGLPDLVVGSLGVVRVLSGADGALLWTANGSTPGDLLGASVAGLGDVNGDGHDDVAAGAPYVLATRSGCDEGPGYVRVYSGLDGSVLAQVDGEGLWSEYDCTWGPRSEAFGLSLTGVGDWDGDGTNDFAVGAPGGGPFVEGRVRVFSGVDGTLLVELAGEPFYSVEFGISLAGAPNFDTDGDGYVELVVGEQRVAYGSGVTEGMAHVFSSATDELIGGIEGSRPFGYANLVGPGYAVSTAGDFDLDGHSDWAFGNPVAHGLLGPGVGEIVVVSGLSNAVLERFTGSSSWDYLGYALAGVGDANGDGRGDVLGLARGNLGTQIPAALARARVFAGN